VVGVTDLENVLQEVAGLRRDPEEEREQRRELEDDLEEEREERRRLEEKVEEQQTLINALRNKTDTNKSRVEELRGRELERARTSSTRTWTTTMSTSRRAVSSGSRRRAVTTPVSQAPRMQSNVVARPRLPTTIFSRSSSSHVSTRICSPLRPSPCSTLPPCGVIESVTAAVSGRRGRWTSRNTSTLQTSDHSSYHGRPGSRGRTLSASPHRPDDCR
jgi:hypothetical protein